MYDKLAKIDKALESRIIKRKNAETKLEKLNKLKDDVKTEGTHTQKRLKVKSDYFQESFPGNFFMGLFHKLISNSTGWSTQKATWLFRGGAGVRDFYQNLNLDP